MDERLRRTGAAVREAGADWGVLTAADSIAYATGHAPAIEAGPSPFAGGPMVAFVGADGGSGLVVPNVEAVAAACARVDEVATYEGYAWEHAAPLVANHAAAMRRLAARLGIGGRLAVKPASFTAALAGALPAAGAPVDLTPALTRARMTKTAGELALLRRCAETAAVGQAAFLRAARPGRTELAVFADVRLAMEEHAGERLAVAGDLLSGAARTAGFTGWPTGRVIEAGDPVLADLAPRVGGYWGDSCAALVVGGEPSEGFRRQFRAARAALDRALEVMRPGLLASALDREVRAVVAREGYRFPHHAGHSIGAAVHEHPRLVPFDDTPLEADMVLMVEPGAYDPEVGGVRLEWMVRVTANGGGEPLAPFAHVMGTG